MRPCWPHSGPEKAHSRFARERLAERAGFELFVPSSLDHLESDAYDRCLSHGAPAKHLSWKDPSRRYPNRCRDLRHEGYLFVTRHLSSVDLR